jgi:Holliday junction DNA helicase RuvA
MDGECDIIDYMIAHVSGVVAEKFANSVIVDVHDVGYEVHVATGDFDRALLGEPIKFYTYHHIREQSQELFGFSSLAAKKLFELLITVQGVGPKAALAILSLGESELVRNAIARGDSGFVSKASGVGKKIAERVVVDLSDKVGLAVNIAHSSGVGATPVGDEALEALMALGYSLNDAIAALENVPTTLSTAERVTLALKGQG